MTIQIIPLYYISDDWGIFPIEMVHAVIEVKTTLRKGNNKATITELYKSFRENKDLRTHSKNKTYLQKHPVILENGKAVIGYDPISHDLPPRFFIFAYDVDEKDFPNIQKLKSFLIEKVCSQEEYNTHYHGIYVLKKNWFLYRKAHQDEHTAVEFEGDDAWVVFLNQMNFSLEDVVLPYKIDMTRYIEGLDKTLSFTDGCSPMGLKDED